MKGKWLHYVLGITVLVFLNACSTSCAGPSEPTPDAAAPIQSTVPATPSQTPEEDIDKIITDLVMERSAPNIHSVKIDSKSYFTDSSDGTWIKFTVSAVPESIGDACAGIVRKVPGGEWQLINLQMDTMECDIPVDVQSGLGLAVCPTTYAEDINGVIRTLVPASTGSGITDISIDHKRFYTDSSGTEWVRFQILPMPKGVGDLIKGIMRKRPGGDWELVARGSGGEECGLPADVQTGLGYTVICNQPV